MTATSVNGLAVIADEATRSPITDRAGKPVYWQQIRTLLLEDESQAYGCAHCDYTSSNPASIRPHLNKHNKKTPAANGTGHRAADLTLTDLLAKLAELEKVTSERDAWKRRAVKAERSLNALREALKP